MNIRIRKNATFIGLIAIVLWSTMVGLIHSVSELIGPLGGIAMIYTFASALLIVTLGVPPIKTFSWRYLLIILTAAALWIKFFFSEGVALNISIRAIMYVLMAGCAIGFGYAAWNFGILHGNVSILVSTSYFTPVLSSLLASFLLNVPLSISFWQGVLMVSLGSILCWQATKEGSTRDKVCSS